MQRLFSIYPHHGYLNTGIYISCLSSERNVSITCRHDNGQDSHEESYSLDGLGRLVFLPAGKHTFSCRLESGEEQIEEITIEDAIKLGGGKLVGGCLSGKSNWCVIKMTDRLYFHNKSTGEEYYEMSVVPDKMRFLNEHTLLFFSKGSGYSIYSFTTRGIVKNFSDEPIFEDDTRIVIQKTKESVAVIDITDPNYPETHLDGSYFAVNQNESLLYYCANNHIISYDIPSIEVKSKVENDGELISILPSGHYVTRVPQGSGVSTIQLRSATTNHVLCYPKADYRIISCLEVSDVNIEELKSKYTDFCRSLSNSERLTVTLNYSTVDEFFVVGDTVYYAVSNHRIANSIDDNVKVLYNSKNQTKIGLRKTVVKVMDGNLIANESSREEIDVYIKGNKVNSFNGRISDKYIITNEKPQSLMDLNGNLIARGDLIFRIAARDNKSWSTIYLNLLQLDCYIRNYNGKSLLYRVGNDKYLGEIDIKSAILFEGTLILFNGDWKNKQYLLVTKEHVAVIDDSIRNNLKVIADDLSMVVTYYDKTFTIHDTRRDSEPTSILTSLYDSSSYKEALFATDKDIIILSDRNNQFHYLNLSSGERTEFDPGIFVKHINGYRPVLDVKPRKPRIIDPVSGQIINPSDFDDYIFCSPDGKCHVGANPISQIEYKHIIENRYLSAQEYQEYDKLNIPPLTNASEDIQIARKQIMLEHPSWFVSKFKGIDIQTIRRYASGDNGLNEHTCHELDYYVNHEPHFTEAFIYVNEYIMIYSSYGSAPKKVDLGRPLWYINYISFSYDGKMMAVAGRYPYNTFDKEAKQHLSGLFLLYDIEKDRIIYKRTDTYAVWVTAFNRDGLVAFYDSNPNTFILDSNNPGSQIIDNNPGDIKDIGCINRRNFLCFSPSGKYIAMSEQGYVCYSSDISSWGHQPSTNVYIRGCKNLNKDIAHYNDHGDNITGIGVRQQTVAMVAFSTDDSKLLSVSNDGVIVVRNLHLE